MTGVPESKDERRGAGTWLFNPFHYVAGWRALAIGSVAMLAAGAIAVAAGARFDGTLDFHQSPVETGLPWWTFLVDAAAAWLPLGCLLYLGGRLISKSRIRAVDVFGTQALARVPTVLAALFSLPPGVRRYTLHLLRMVGKLLQQYEGLIGQAIPQTASVQVRPLDVAVFTAAMVAILVAVVWTVALMYRAFAVSCNVRGGKAIGVFIVAVVLAEAVSKAILFGVACL